MTSLPEHVPLARAFQPFNMYSDLIMTCLCIETWGVSRCKGANEINKQFQVTNYNGGTCMSLIRGTGGFIDRARKINKTYIHQS